MARLAIIFDTIGYMGLRGLAYGAGIGVIWGTVVAQLFGSLYGPFLGVMIGLPTSIIGGTMIGVVRIMFHHPVYSELVFRWTIRIIGGTVAFTGGFIGCLLLVVQTYAPLDERLRTMFSVGGLFFWLVPTLIATVSAFFVCDRFVDQYLAKSGDDKINNGTQQQSMTCD